MRWFKMVDSLDEEEQNRLIKYMTLENIESEQGFWEEFNDTFRSKANTKMGKVLLNKIKSDYGELPHRSKTRRVFIYKGTHFTRAVIYRKHRHYIAFRDVKTGRFIKVS
jgi:hypothetical protein